MLKIKKLFEPSVGDRVIVKSNSCNHSYQIGNEYEIIHDNLNGTYTLGIVSDVRSTTATIPIGAQNFHGIHIGAIGQHWIGIQDLDLKIDQKILIDDISNMLEFLNDYEGDISNLDKLEKEYKVYHILKEVKSEKSDFEKISIISRYI